MYIHLGQETVVWSKDVIGIFDLDTSTVSKHTRDFLSKSQKSGEVINVTYELPKSFVLCSKSGKNRVYISQISTSTLQRRADFISNL